ncbi:LINE-1 retrotransposable element ORF2 protein [Holothuria leucospilota]|uniref:LINE-1 retrotransposable element ORF2 protein n=1 Tax=Holothuria leucospilota TaxID=206669 RepID=A0A9Q1BPT6_HOLLE|nr:LINE-1 retrotransposable element ORF2 protein [Holothuria leucospilota]
MWLANAIATAFFYSRHALHTTFRLPTLRFVCPLANILDAPPIRNWHLIDYVIIRKDEQNNVRVTKARCGVPQAPQLWKSKKADEIQTFADSKNVRCFYEALNTVYGPRSSRSSPVLNADDTKLLTDRKQILERWAEHFNSVLNRPLSINNNAIDRLPQVKTNYTLGDLPIEHQVEKAIHQMPCGKAPGSDSIPAEVFKVGGQALLKRLTQLYQLMWKEEQLPQQFKDTTVVHIYKQKGNPQSCDNHRGISLLSFAGKTFARILLNRLLPHLKQDLLPESQCGSRAGRGTVDMIFVTRQL